MRKQSAYCFFLRLVRGARDLQRLTHRPENSHTTSRALSPSFHPFISREDMHPDSCAKPRTALRTALWRTVRLPPDVRDLSRKRAWVAGTRVLACPVGRDGSKWTMAEKVFASTARDGLKGVWEFHSGAPSPLSGQISAATMPTGLSHPPTPGAAARLRRSSLLGAASSAACL